MYITTTAGQHAERHVARHVLLALSRMHWGRRAELPATTLCRHTTKHSHVRNAPMSSHGPEQILYTIPDTMLNRLAALAARIKQHGRKHTLLPHSTRHCTLAKHSRALECACMLPHTRYIPLFGRYSTKTQHEVQMKIRNAVRRRTEATGRRPLICDAAARNQ